MAPVATCSYMWIHPSTPHQLNPVREHLGDVRFVLSQVSEARPGAPIFAGIDTLQKKQILHSAYPINFVNGAPSRFVQDDNSFFGFSGA